GGTISVEPFCARPETASRRQTTNQASREATARRRWIIVGVRLCKSAFTIQGPFSPVGTFSTTSQILSHVAAVCDRRILLHLPRRPPGNAQRPKYWTLGTGTGKVVRGMLVMGIRPSPIPLTLSPLTDNSLVMIKYLQMRNYVEYAELRGIS